LKQRISLQTQAKKEKNMNRYPGTKSLFKTNLPNQFKILIPLRAVKSVSKCSNILSGVLLFLLSVLSTSGQNQTAPDIQPLPPGARLEREISAPQIHQYTFDLQREEFFQVRVEQKNIDVSLRFLDAQDKELAQMNGNSKNKGFETLSYIAESAGSFKLEVKIQDKKAIKGNYAVQREAARTAAMKDKRRVEIERVFVEAIKTYSSRGQEENAVKKFSEALDGWRELEDVYMTDLTSLWLALTKARAAFFRGRSLFGGQVTKEKLREAIKVFDEAAVFYGQADEAYSQGGAFLGVAVAALHLGQMEFNPEYYKQANEYNKKAWQIYREMPEMYNEKTDLLVSIAQMYYVLGDKISSLEYFEMALAFYKKLDKQAAQASTENDMGMIYYQLGQYDKALEYLNRALPIRQKINDKCGLPATLTNLGVVYSVLGYKAKALNFTKDQSLPLYKAEADCVIEKASTLTNIGLLYYDLGENELALDFYKKSLPLFKATKNIAGEAATRNNIGSASYALAEQLLINSSDSKSEAENYYKKALESYDEAYNIYKKTAEKKYQFTSLTNIGVTHAALGETEKGIEILKQALRLKREIGDKNGEAVTLNDLGEIYSKLNKKTEALEYFNQALPLFKAAGDRNGEAKTLGNAMAAWKSLGNRRMAIFYGKQSVNKFQQLRGATKGVERDVQQTFLRSVKSSYKYLAELLIEEGLYNESVQVLNFFQDQEFFDFNSDVKASVPQIKFSRREQKFANRYDLESQNVGRIGSEIERLKQQFGISQPSEEQKKQLQKLEAEFKAASDAFLAFLTEAGREFVKPSAKKDKVAVNDASEMKKSLAYLSNKTKKKNVAIYTLIGENNLYLLLITPDGNIKPFSSPIKEVDLKNRIDDFRQVLYADNKVIFKPYERAAELYKIIFKATATSNDKTTLEAELDKYKSEVLHWSLDGSLRYIPMAALYDDERKSFVVEKYETAVFTRAKRENFEREQTRWESGLGLGTSKGFGSFGDLKSVPDELKIIFGEPDGLLKGKILLNESFTRESMINALRAEPKPAVVHIPSHFKFVAGDVQSSFLLLGGTNEKDREFSLYEMQEHPNLFGSVDLLTAAACNTAATESNANGKEIDAFAELAQRLGAKSVIATLWQVDDGGTSHLMIEFYRLYTEHLQKNKNTLPTKSALLRQAQLNLLRGSKKFSDSVCGAGFERSDFTKKPSATSKLDPFEIEPQKPCAHPYFWAPFVLYGNPR
jgi:CHAT domain-containing protein/tetratricopeptide (TPR) repeat protein